MAATQLGSEHAHVRITGVYALERLAQNNSDQRQVIVNVLCAYLRMPHTIDGTDSTEPDTDRGLDRTQERQVRLTAQRLLTTHLRRDHSGDAFWPDITLDLAGATLLGFNLAHCHLHGATFDNARFTGDARFINTVWTGPVDFTRARFDLTTAELRRIDAVFTPSAVVGTRYPDMSGLNA
jgi:hypothetical protein